MTNQNISKFKPVQAHRPKHRPLPGRTCFPDAIDNVQISRAAAGLSTTTNVASSHRKPSSAGGTKKQALSLSLSSLTRTSPTLLVLPKIPKTTAPRRNPHSGSITAINGSLFRLLSLFSSSSAGRRSHFAPQMHARFQNQGSRQPWRQRENVGFP